MTSNFGVYVGEKKGKARRKGYTQWIRTKTELRDQEPYPSEGIKRTSEDDY